MSFVRYPLEDRYRPGLKFAVALGLAGLGAVVLAIAVGRFEDETDPTASNGRAPADVSAADPVPPAAPRPTAHEIVTVEHGARVPLLDAPNGDRLGTVGDTTSFGNPTVLSVAQRRGPWLGVESELAGNDPVAWVEAAQSRLAEGTTRYSLTVDPIASTLELMRGRLVAETMPLTVGSNTKELPSGRFAVSDKVEGHISPALGPGALALTAVSESLPPDWPVGDRLAIHGGPRDDAASALQVRNADMRTLLDDVPRGAPVFVIG